MRQMDSAVPLSGETFSCDWSDLSISTFRQPIDSAAWKIYRFDEVCVAVSAKGPMYWTVLFILFLCHSLVVKVKFWQH